MRKREMTERKEAENKRSREGGDRTPQERKQKKVTVFARVSLNQKEAKVENTHIHAHTCAHTQFLLVPCDLVVPSFSYTLNFNE